MSDNGGERELVLGNKQLLAIFFVAALLCGVFFAVGYVVGGNSAKSGAAPVADAASAPTTDGKRDEPPAVPAMTDGTAGAAGATAATGLSPADAAALPGPEPRMADNPAASGPAPEQTAPPVTAKPIPPAQAPAATGMDVSLPEKGATYLQITARKRPDADNVAKTLRDRGWPAILATSSKPELVEVLVGPYRSAIAVADAKRKLTELGFTDLIVHKQ